MLEINAAPRWDFVRWKRRRRWDINGTPMEDKTLQWSSGGSVSYTKSFTTHSPRCQLVPCSCELRNNSPHPDGAMRCGSCLLTRSLWQQDFITESKVTPILSSLSLYIYIYVCIMHVWGKGSRAVAPLEGTNHSCWKISYLWATAIGPPAPAQSDLCCIHILGVSYEWAGTQCGSSQDLEEEESLCQSATLTLHNEGHFEAHAEQEHFQPRGHRVWLTQLFITAQYGQFLYQEVQVQLWSISGR